MHSCDREFATTNVHVPQSGTEGVQGILTCGCRAGWHIRFGGVLTWQTLDPWGCGRRLLLSGIQWLACTDGRRPAGRPDSRAMVGRRHIAASGLRISCTYTARFILLMAHIAEGLVMARQIWWSRRESEGAHRHDAAASTRTTHAHSAIVLAE